MRPIFLAAIVFCILTFVPYPCLAKNVVHEVEDAFTMDKWVHFGAGYIINDRLKRDTELTPLERILVISAVAYAKEKWADDHFDRGDMNATILGGLVYETNF